MSVSLSTPLEGSAKSLSETKTNALLSGGNDYFPLLTLMRASQGDRDRLINGNIGEPPLIYNPSSDPNIIAPTVDIEPVDAEYTAYTNIPVTFERTFLQAVSLTDSLWTLRNYSVTNAVDPVSGQPIPFYYYHLNGTQMIAGFCVYGNVNQLPALAFSMMSFAMRFRPDPAYPVGTGHWLGMKGIVAAHQIDGTMLKPAVNSDIIDLPTTLPLIGAFVVGTHGLGFARPTQYDIPQIVLEYTNPLAYALVLWLGIDSSGLPSIEFSPAAKNLYVMGSPSGS